jgi:hypothetical protein
MEMASAAPVHGRRRQVLGALLALVLLGSCPLPALPQAVDVSTLLTSEEQARLARERNPVKQIRQLLKIAEKRLHDITRLAREERFEAVPPKLQAYQALLEYTFSQIEGVPPGGKRQNAYKDFDLFVRRQLKDLDALLRVLPIGMAADAERVLKTATTLRFEALNAFAGEKILTRPRSKSH